MRRLKEICLKSRLGVNIVLNEKIVLGVILAVLIVIYNFVWINKSYVMAENWADFYDGLLDMGKVPYRDFYYQMPPINLLVDRIILKMSFGYKLMYRMWRLAEKLIIAEIMYSLLIKRVHPYIACMGCFASAVLFSANVHDVAGDYNQTSQFLIALLCVFMLQYGKNIDATKKKARWMFLSGICGGVMLVHKQTVTLACACCFAVLMLIFVFFKKERKFFRSVLCVVIGAAIPLVITCIYLGAHHAIKPFFYQVFVDISAKGNLYSITIGKFVTLFQTKFYEILALFCILAAYTISEKIRKEKPESKGLFAAEKFFVAVAALLLGYRIASIFIEAWSFCLATGIAALLVILQLITGFGISPVSKSDKIVVLFLLCTTFAVWIANPNGITIDFCEKTSLFTFLKDDLLNLIFVFLLIWLFFHIIQCKIKREGLDIEALTLASTGIASGFTTMMSNGEPGIVTISAILVVPAFIYVIFRDKDIHTFFPVRILQTSILLIFGICLSWKLTHNYAWWGDTEASYWEKTESVDIKKLAGIKFSKREKAKIEGLCNLIDYYTDEDSVIWGFPYVEIYNYLLGNYNMNGFVPVLFYDVCADDYAIQEAKLLANNEPDIVVWLDMPNCMEVYENVFRNGGRLGQREIQKWFSGVKDTDYTLIGQLDNVFVYKLNDGTSVSYTYIEHKTAVNTTAVYDETVQETLECTLSGSGTVQSPFLISSVEDLETFRDLVNNGMNFAGQYIRQTEDIDLQKCGNWEPIGIFESGKLFAGNYDGDGYAIKGLYINRPEENVSLFGQLAGTVENLSVIDCDITGSCIGGIASHGVGVDSKIINCLVTGRLYSYGRAGGIADNMGGSIINCVTNVDLKGVVTSGISGYYTNTVENCYSFQGGESVSADNGMEYTVDSIDDLNAYIKKWKNSDYGKLLNEWELVDGEIRLMHKY